MKITMDCSQYGPVMARNAGDVLDVPGNEGQRLIDGLLAHKSTKAEIALASAKTALADEAAAKAKDEVEAKEEAEAKAKEEAEVNGKKQRHEKTERAVNEDRETAVSH